MEKYSEDKTQQHSELLFQNILANIATPNSEEKKDLTMESEFQHFLLSVRSLIDSSVQSHSQQLQQVHEQQQEKLKQEYLAAVAHSEISLVVTIKKDKAWVSKAWLLERRFPLRWGVASQRPWESLPEFGDPDFNPLKKP